MNSLIPGANPQRFVYICHKQPYIWFREWTKVYFCSKCGAGMHGTQVMSSMWGPPDLCLYCGHTGYDFTSGAARVRKFSTSTWWKPWTWNHYRIEADIRPRAEG